MKRQISKDTFDIENSDKSEDITLLTPQKPLGDLYGRFHTEIEGLNNAPKLFQNKVKFDQPPLQKRLSTDSLEVLDDQELSNLDKSVHKAQNHKIQEKNKLII